MGTLVFGSLSYATFLLQRYYISTYLCQPKESGEEKDKKQTPHKAFVLQQVTMRKAVCTQRVAHWILPWNALNTQHLSSALQV